MASNDNRNQSNRSNANKPNPWVLGLGAAAIGAVAAVGGYLLGKSNAEEEAEFAKLQQQHERGFLPSTPKQRPNNSTTTTTNSTTSTTPGGASTGNSTENAGKDDEEKQECAICLRSYQELNKLEEEIHTTPCGHVFCYNCISQSLPVRAKCPICNCNVKPGQTMRLFL